MTSQSNLVGAKLSIALDLRHPFSYLALGPALRLARELDLEINWLPLVAQPLRAPSEPRDDDDRGARHKHHRANMIAREIEVYANAQGLRLQQPYRDGPADGANLAWLWVRKQDPGALPAFLQELFRRYWALELEAGDVGATADVVSACALDADSFRAWAADEGPRAATALADELAEAGVFQSPAYLVDDQIFYGRQHLPMIRWLLEGRAGHAPI